ncbi:hypothetical protein ACHAWC_006323 [Mediolabrus comicus]
MMRAFAAFILLLPATATAFVAVGQRQVIITSPASSLKSSPLDDFLGNIFGNDDKKKNDDSVKNINDDDEEINLSSFQKELSKRQQQQDMMTDSEEMASVMSITDADDNTEEEEEFDGYAMRDAILNKWGECFDVDFNRVDSYGFRSVYLNILPFRLGGKRFRHETELDYLCHLQAVVEILQKYDQLDYVLAQLNETNKKPRAGTSPLIAVPLRLDLTEEQVNQILG